MAVRCVIVDDNRDFLRAARELLDNEGISVVGVASTGAQAGRACRDLRPDVVLVDFELGEEAGPEVARQLVGQQAGPTGPCVILISAHSGEDFEEIIADSPAISFLAKAELSGPAIRGILARAASLDQEHQRDSR